MEDVIEIHVSQVQLVERRVLLDEERDPWGKRIRYRRHAGVAAIARCRCRGITKAISVASKVSTDVGPYHKNSPSTDRGPVHVASVTEAAA